MTISDKAHGGSSKARGAHGVLLVVALIVFAALPAAARAQVVVPHPAQVIVPELETPEPVEREPPPSTQASNEPPSGPPAQLGGPPPGWGWQPAPPAPVGPPPAPPEPPTDNPNGPYDVDCGSVCLRQWVNYYEGLLSAVDDPNATIPDRTELHFKIRSLLSDLERDIDDAVEREANADEYRRMREEREPKLPVHAEPDAISGGDLDAEPEPAPEYTEVTDEVVGPCPSFNPLRIADWIAGDGGSAGCF